MPEPLTAEEFAAILWPGMFREGWRDLDWSDSWYQAHLYCLKKAEDLLKHIEVRRRI